MSAEPPIKPGLLRSSRLLHLFFRIPLILYRIGLGSLMPMQMQITTIGRKSGKPHRVVVDIVREDKTKDVFYVSAAFGPRSDWYLNLRANPTVYVQVGLRKFTARAITLPLKEAEDMLVKFVLRHPYYLHLILRGIGLIMRVIGIRIKMSEEEYCRGLTQMPVVAIQPERP